MWGRDTLIHVAERTRVMLYNELPTLCIKLSLAIIKSVEIESIHSHVIHLRTYEHIV